MAQTFLARKYLNESTEVHDTGNLSEVNLTNLNLAHNLTDDGNSLIRSLYAGSTDTNGAVFFDINLNAGILNNLLDNLSARSNDIADLISLNLDSSYTWRIWTKLSSRLGDALEHLA